MNHHGHSGQEPALRVLVADDDPIQRSLIAARLLKLDGHAIEAEDGGVAWSLLSSQEFDLAIVDLGMPNLDGIGLIQCMRGHPRTRHLPIIVVTSQTDRASIEAAFGAGASSFLTKPVVWSTFEHHVGFLLRLVQAAKDARCQRQRYCATDRAKAAIVNRICSETNASAGLLVAEVEKLIHMAALSRATVGLLDGLSLIRNEIELLRGSAQAASTAVDALSQGVYVDSRRTPLLDLLQAAQANVAPLARQAQVMVRTNSPAPTVSIACDASAIELAITHLLRNAIQHSPPAAVVTIAAKVYPDGLLAIEIDDSGLGMHPQLIAQYLGSAIDAAMLAQPISGGFGLLLAKAVAEAHDGSVELRSMPHKGLSATLIVPAERVSQRVEAA